VGAAGARPTSESHVNRPQARPARHLSPSPVAPLVHAPNAALLIDFDNVTLGIRSDLTKELKNLLNSDIIKGKVAVQRAYADWRRYPQYIVPLSESSIDLIFAPAFGTNKKNATDIRLAVDAVELVFTRPEIGTFIIMSGDSDFSTMVIKLKEYGKYVIGVGIRESASDILIQNCDEYYSYSDLAGLTREADVPSVQRDPWELAAEAVTQMARNGDVMRSDRLKQVMQQIDSNFDERNVGLNRFSKFVLEAAQRGLLHLTKLDNGQYEVAPAAGAAAATTGAPANGTAAPAREGEEAAAEGGRRERDRDRDRGRRGRGRGRERSGERSDRDRGHERREQERPSERERPAASGRDGVLTLARAFQLMTQALGELRAPVTQEPLRLRMIAMHGREDTLLEASRFPRLLRQANDAEVADIRKIGEDDYEIAPIRGAGTGAPPAAPAATVTPREPARTPPEGEPMPALAGAGTTPSSAANDRDNNGQRLGLRFRHGSGSRRPTRPGEIPLVGVVKIDEPAAAVTVPAVSDATGSAAESAADDEGASGKTGTAKRGARTRRPPAKRAKAAAATTAATTAAANERTSEGAEAAPADSSARRAKRPRPRPRKKTE